MLLALALVALLGHVLLLWLRDVSKQVALRCQGCSPHAGQRPRIPPGPALVQPWRPGQQQPDVSGRSRGLLPRPVAPEPKLETLDAELVVRAPVRGDGTWTPPTPAELAQVESEGQGVPVVNGWEVLSPTDARLDQPLVLQELTEAWPARGWSREELLDRVGDTELRIRPCASLHEFGFPGPGNRRASLRDYFAAAERDLGEVVFENDFQPVHNALREGYSIPNLLSGVHSTPVFSCGRANTGIGFHRHHEAWLAQLHGRKAWFLLPPKAPRPAVLPPWWYLQERPPELHVAVLRPGEVLFLPANWWHATWNLDDFTVALGWEGGASRCWEPDAHAIADGDISRVDAADVPAPNVTVLAARAGHAEILRLLIEEDADLALRANAAPVALAAARGGHVATLELLTGYRTALAPGAGGRTALHAAAQYGQPEAASWLLARRADLRQRDAEGLEPLHLASSYGHAEVVSVLLEAHADVHATQGEGSTALLGAAFNGHRPVVEALLDAGAEAEARDALQMEALHLAALRGHAPVAEELLSRRAQVAARDRIARTPLHLAAHGYEDSDDRSGGIRTAPDANLAVAEVLLRAGADPQTLDLRGKRPADYATEKGHFGVAQRLEQAPRPPLSQRPPPDLQPAVTPPAASMPGSDVGGDTAMRVAEDGEAYTFAQFLEWYGEDEGRVRWERAVEAISPSVAPPPPAPDAKPPLEWALASLEDPSDDS